MPIVFHNEEIDFTIKKKAALRIWITELLSSFYKKIGDINYIFCNDDYLLNINKKHLLHDTLTDIITFDTGDSASTKIDGDIFISIERVKENGITHSTTFEEELIRVMSHGLLHLIGFKDKEEQDIVQMRQAEQNAISLFNKLTDVPRGTSVK